MGIMLVGWIFALGYAWEESKPHGKGCGGGNGELTQADVLWTSSRRARWVEGGLSRAFWVVKLGPRGCGGWIWWRVGGGEPGDEPEDDGLFVGAPREYEVAVEGDTISVMRILRKEKGSDRTNQSTASV